MLSGEDLGRTGPAEDRDLAQLPHGRKQDTMALSDRQHGLVTDVLHGNHGVQEWDEPWDMESSDDLMWGGYPLKPTGERWDRRTADSLRIRRARYGIDCATWLTAEEVAAYGARPGPWTRSVELEIQDGTTLLYNAAEITGLPEHLYRPFWEIHPVHREPRRPGLEQYVRSLGLDIRHFVEPEDGRMEARYDTLHGYIQMPPFEMFFSAADYYHTLAHELVHWAVASTDLVNTILDSEAADYARNELVAEFAAMFLLAEQGFSDLPHPRTVAYVRKWCDKGSLTDAEAMEAAGDAGRVTAWLCHEAPAWRAGETHRRMPPGSHSPALGDVPTLRAAAAARRFVKDVLALERSIAGKDRDAWNREAARLLEAAGTIDLAIPAVVAAVEAAVALETPLDTPPRAADAWIRGFRERTQRILAMRSLAQKAADMSLRPSHGARFG